MCYHHLVYLATTPNINHCHKSRQLTSTVRQGMKICSVESDGVQHQDPFAGWFRPGDKIAAMSKPEILAMKPPISRSWNRRTRST
jgi:hypothetical protein